MSNPNDEQNKIRQCDFCGRIAPPEEPFGTAYTYIKYPDSDGSIQGGGSDSVGNSGVEEVRICLGCAFAHEPTPQGDDAPFKYTGKCDLCGHVGPNAGGNTGDGYYRLQDIMSWTVRIQGFEGTVTVCRDCTPIADWDLFRRESVEYGRDLAFEVPTRKEVGQGRISAVRSSSDAPEPDQATLSPWEK